MSYRAITRARARAHTHTPASLDRRRMKRLHSPHQLQRSAAARPAHAHRGPSPGWRGWAGLHCWLTRLPRRSLAPSLARLPRKPVPRTSCVHLRPATDFRGRLITRRIAMMAVCEACWRSMIFENTLRFWVDPSGTEQTEGPESIDSRGVEARCEGRRMASRERHVGGTAGYRVRRRDAVAAGSSGTSRCAVADPAK